MRSGRNTLESMSQAVWYNRWTLNKFAKFLKGDILEVGCGIGNFTKELAKYGKVWAFDIDKENIVETKKKVGKNVEVGFGDIEQGEYFFKEKRFNSIVCLNVLEHIKDDKKALENLFNLLESDGYLIILVPSHLFLMGEIDKAIGHYRRYSFNDLSNFINSGYSVIYKKRINFLGAIGWYIAGKILKEKSVNLKKLGLFNLLAPFFLFFEDFLGTPIGTSILIIYQKNK